MTTGYGSILSTNTEQCNVMMDTVLPSTLPQIHVNPLEILLSEDKAATDIKSDYAPCCHKCKKLLPKIKKKGCLLNVDNESCGREEEFCQCTVRRVSVSLYLYYLHVLKIKFLIL